MEKEKNIIIIVNQNLKENIYMEKETIIIKMVNYNLKENIKMEKDGKEKDII